MADSRPLLAITLGDPAGIGPEVILKALQHGEVFASCRPLVIGDRQVLARAAEWLGTEPRYRGHRRSRRSRAAIWLTPSPCWTWRTSSWWRRRSGQVSAGAGRAAVEYVQRACDMALAGQAAAVVTAPLNKEAMHRAGFLYPGHTELLAERTGAERVSMLLVGPNLRVVHVSTHVSLEEAIRRVTPPRVLEVIELAHHACQALGIERAAHRGRRAEPPRKRKRALRRAGRDADPACHRIRAGARLDGFRSAAARHRLSAHHPRRVRHRRRHVPRPGPHSDEAARLR